MPTGLQKPPEGRICPYSTDDLDGCLNLDHSQRDPDAGLSSSACQAAAGCLNTQALIQNPTLVKAGIRKHAATTGPPPRVSHPPLFVLFHFQVSRGGLSLMTLGPTNLSSVQT